MLIDTHCHIHDTDYPLDALDVIDRAKQASVTKMICIGTDEINSRVALEFASKHDEIFAAIGVHPHNALNGWGNLADMIRRDNPSLIAIGEIGLDYHYDNSPHDIQIRALKAQIELAIEHNLPIIFHIREAFDDFWPIFDEYIAAGNKIRGVLHSFTDSKKNADEGLKRGLYIGVNGYSTFTKDNSQKDMFAKLPLDRILLETDAPYLTPAPFRGKVNEPAFVRNIADYHSIVRQISFDKVASATTANAQALFGI